jgi:hypothetical protein
MAKILIAGEQLDSESKQTTEVRNPATGEVVDSVPKPPRFATRRPAKSSIASPKEPSMTSAGRSTRLPAR